MLNNKTLLHIALPVALTVGGCMAQEIKTPHIARYHGDAKAAFSYTFDDGFRQEVTDALSVINPLGIRGTFFVTPQAIKQDPVKFIDWESLRKMEAGGHEIGTHTRFQYDAAAARELICRESDLLRDHAGISPVSFAYHYEVPAAVQIQAAVTQRYPFVRGQVEGYGSVPGRRDWTREKAEARVQQAMAQGEWITAMVHSIINGYSPFKSVDEFRSHSEWLVKQGKDLWIAPMGEVGRYVRERDAANLNILKSEPAAVQFELLCDIKPATLYNAPLTVVIPVATAKSATATTGGKELPVAIRDGKILVDVPPGTGPVMVEWK